MKAAAVALLVVVGAGFAGCRKPAPEELVFTGNPPGSGGSGTGGVGGTPIVDAGDAGGSGGSAGGGLGGAPPDVPFTKQNFLVQVADCAMAHYSVFRERATAFRESAADADSDAAGAWLAAIDAWQEAELFRFGPAARPSEPGGQDFRDNIYSWPLVSRCSVDEQLVSQAYAQPGFPTTLANGRGLWAAEYLLFYPGTDNGCSQFSTINASGSWAALDAAELSARKRAYALEVAKDVEARANGLVAAWDPAAGNFRYQLVEAGNGSSVFATDQKALNAVSDALFYLDKELKDLKIGRPLGLVDCFSASCPEAVESPFAGRSLAHISANLVGFRRLFEGCYDDGAGLGFDDWLRAVGAGDLADEMVKALADARVAVAAVPGPLEHAVVENPAAVQAAYDAIKKLNDPLKSEFIGALNLELPKPVETDND